MLRNVRRARDFDALLARLALLRADSPRRWGRMTPHQAVCHLSDSMRATLGDWSKPPARTPPMRWLIRSIAFTVPLRWPHGVRTARELDQQRDGTRPVEFERDRAELVTLLRRVASSDELPPHPLWGRMSRGMTGRYVWRHTDHHLRQFGA
ncbi:MAG TPA: DUF1569 domain-containing protein [Longimicrobiales bacterium]